MSLRKEVMRYGLKIIIPVPKSNTTHLKHRKYPNLFVRNTGMKNVVFPSIVLSTCLVIATGCDRAGTKLMVGGQTERIVLPPGWKVAYVQEPFSSAGTELENPLPTAPKAKVKFTREPDAWVEMYVTTALWTPDDIKRYHEDIKGRIQYAMELPFYVGQSKKFRFMYIQGARPKELLEVIRSLTKG
jgi:hypothetical protein